MMGFSRSLLLLSLVPLFTQQQSCGSDDDDDTSTPVPELVDCMEQSRDFWAWDLSIMPPRSVVVPATCILTGPHSYLYVADDQWDQTVTAEMAEAFMTTFEFASSPDALDPDLGIFGNDRIVFGDIPDALDDDPRMYILLMDIKDYVNDEGEVFSFDGYFNAYDQIPDPLVYAQTLGLYHSNEVEMLYLNSRIRPVTDPYSLAVAAHELQHLIAYNYDTSEEVWISESEAEVAMLVNGLFTDVGWVEDYASDPSVPLVTSFSGNYGSFLLWGMYLHEQIGNEFMRSLEAEPEDGIAGLNAALTAYGAGVDFNLLFSDWIVANAVQDVTVAEGHYGYLFSDALPEMAAVASFSASGGQYTGDIEAFGVNYLEVVGATAGATLTVTAPTADTFVARLIGWGPEGVTVTTWAPDAQGRWTVPLEGGDGWEYLLAVSNVNTRQIDSGATVTYQVSVR